MISHPLLVQPSCPLLNYPHYARSKDVDVVINLGTYNNGIAAVKANTAMIKKDC